MHVPQNIGGEIELRHLAAIPWQLVDPASNAPIIGIYQDSMLGSYRFTRQNINFNSRDAMNLLMMFNNVDVQKLREKKENISSFDILSQILPPMTTKFDTKLIGPNDDPAITNNILEIRNGEYIRGQMEKSVLGSSTKGIIHRICNDFGNMAAVDFIDNLQNIITEYMKTSSFSVGVSDLIANKKTITEIIQVITNQKMEVQSVINEVHLGTFKNITANSNNMEFETKVNNLLNKATEQSGKIARESLNKNNRFLMIVESGSKGSLINISQMISCLGQQNVDGKRIPYGFDNRTLPHYNKFDDSPTARGFIENSYISGLTAPELFFHAMGGRIGLIDTAVKTSTTGYIHRRLIKGLEDLKIEYDMTVRNSKGKIVQFAYGDDNFESTKVEHQCLPLVKMSIEEIYMHYDIVGLNDYDSDLLQIYSKGTLSRMKKQKVESKEICKKYIEKMILQRDHIVQKVFKSKNENSVKIPVSFQNIIINIQGQLNLNANSTVDITPKEAFLLIEEYFEKLKQIYFSPPTLLFEIMYYFYLTPKDLLINKRFHRKALVLLLETVVLKYKQSIVHPGEMVGVIAGQSIGAPTTQLSSHGSTKIIISGQQKYNGDVKTFVDKLLEENKEKVIDLGNDSVVMDLIDDYHIVGVSDTEKTSWNRILQISRHPANGNLVKVTTKTGKTHTATLSHSFLKRSETSIVPVKGSDLKVGDRIPVAKCIPEIANPMTEIKIGQDTVLLDKTFGQFIGSYLADGCINYNNISISKNASEVIEETKSMAQQFHSNCNVDSRTKDSIIIPEQNIHYTKEGGYTSVSTSFNHAGLATFIKDEFKTGSAEKLIPAWVFSSNKEFIYGILSGYFNGDGNVNDILGKEIIRCHSISERLIVDMCLLLSYAGIYAAKGVESKERTNKLHTLYISKKYAQLFQDLIGFSTDYKADALKNVIEHNLRENKHSEKEEYDKIPELGNIIAYIGEKLVLSKQSRNYGRWTKKESIGRKTLASYIPIFEQENVEKLSLGKYKKRINNKYHSFIWTQENYDEIESKIAILRQAVHSDVVWDEIVNLEIIEDNGEYVYDFTVPGNDSFMVDCGVLVHNTLNTFHLSGVASKSNVTRGVPRIEEILRLTKNPKNPSLTVHLKPYDEQEKEKATTFANMMEHTKLIDVIQLVEICFDPIEKTTFKEEDRLLMEQFYEFEKMVEDCMEKTEDANPTQVSKWVVRMEMDPETMLDKNITMDDIHFAIKNSHYGNDIHCVYSDYNMDKLVFRIRTNSNIFSKSKKRGAIEPLDQSDEIYLLRNFQDSLLNNIVLRGIHGIENVIPRKLQNMVVKEDGKFIRKDVWVLDTTGSNLLDSLALEFIDSIRTYSNDIKEIFDVLGIEAARQVLYNELVEVMEFADVYINYHHLSLLCDRMTCTKDMVSIFRSGILNDDIGPISKSTFEVHTEVLLNAARHAEFDHMRGVSATVMMGQYGYFGTNAFNLVLDMKEMDNLDVAILDKNDTEEQIEKLFSFKEAHDNDPCSGSNIEIKNNIDSIKRSNEGFCDDDYNMGF